MNTANKIKQYYGIHAYAVVPACCITVFGGMLHHMKGDNDRTEQHAM
jgi:hypothetical protein